MSVALSSDQLALFLAVLARVGGLVVSAPIIGDSNVPQRVKALLAILLAVVLVQVPGLARAHVPNALGPFALLIVVQLLVGLSLGLVARLLFFAVSTAGEIVSLQTGLSIAAVFNPESGAASPIFGQLYTIIAGLVFLALNGDLWLIASLGRSFDLAPIGRVFSPTIFSHALTMAVSVTELGLQIALPIVASIFAATVVLGVISRSMPQLNVFVLSLPINMLLGLLALAASLAATVLLIGHLVDGLPRDMLGP